VTAAGSYHRLLSATRLLAQHTGDVQQRLAEAYTEHLDSPGVAEGLPDDLQAICSQLRRRMQYAGSPDLSARLFSDEEARDLIEIIVGLAANAPAVDPDDFRPDRRHGLERFCKAAFALAQSTDQLPSRLADAYSLNLNDLRPDELSVSAWARLELLGARLTRQSAVGDEGTIVATSRVMSEGEAREIINIVVDLYGQVASEAGR
jgi:hypothetical protein